MSLYRFLVVGAVGSFLLTPNPALARDDCKAQPLSASRTGHHATIELDWRKLSDCVKAATSVNTRVGPRIDEDTTVTIRIRNLNFVLYTASVAIDETVVETYVTLEKLWAQLLGFPVLSAAIPGGGLKLLEDGCQSFAECVAAWAFLVSTTDRALTTARDQHVGIVALSGLQSKEVEASWMKLEVAKKQITEVVEAFTSRFKPADLRQVTDFETVRARHDALFERLAAYQAAALLVKDGQVIQVPKKKPGTLLSITLTPVDRNKTAAVPVANIDYFVHSRLPLVMHVGYSYTSGRDIEFEPVRALSQADLFLKVKDNEGTSDMVAFLSVGQTLWSNNLGVFGTLGTNFSEPGERLYLGISFQFLKRVVITYGTASTAEEVGINSVEEQLAEGAGKRELFGAIQRHRDWRQFGAISFRVF